MTDTTGSADGTALEIKRLELERYKAELSYKKFKWGSVFVAIVIAAIPPAFQYATAHLEAVKTEGARRALAQQFRDNFVKDALSQDIGQRIRFAQYFSSVSSEKSDWKSYLSDLTGQRDTTKIEIDKLEREWLALATQKNADLGDLSEKKRHLDWAYAEIGYAAPNRSAIANPRAPAESTNPTPSVSLTSLPDAKRAIAQLILDKFGAAGFGPFQQVAALANAIAETNLDASAHLAGAEDSWGLFLLNTRGGLGMGHTPEQLMDPNVNIDIILKEAQKYPAFAAASSIDEAVAAFVRSIERPANPVTETARRQQIARQFLRG